MSKEERKELGLLTIAEVAREAGVLRSTVRYYTEIGLLSVAGTFSPKNYRLYSREETLGKISGIKAIQQKNRSLSDIREVFQFA